ncbi:MAG: protein O-mannosyl-transferase family [Bacteroidales bacterium]
MNKKKYNLYNIVVGWLIFLVAAITYIMSIESTASFWDCGEYILSANGLQVGHPPGSPVFLLLGRLFIVLGGSIHPAVMVNIMSAMASAFTILFLFWSITHLAKRLLVNEGEAITSHKALLVLVGGAVGALVYTFSDTFWFSAVEGEVYSLSSLFTAIVFWAILKWESVADEPHSSRWIVLIAFAIGISASIHLLNLLAIPAIVFVFYYKKYNPSLKKAIITFIVSIIILGFVLYGIIINLFSYISGFELFFTNSLGMPYFTGTIVFALLLATAFYFAIKYSIKKNKPALNTLLISTIFVLIGYSSYALILIRSNADTPMNQNDPSTAFRLDSYLNRDQYGDWPLLKGQFYTASPIGNTTKEIWGKKDGKYAKVGRRISYLYPEAQTGFFPRMWNGEQRFLSAYARWGGDGKTVPLVNVRDREGRVWQKPTFGANLKYMLNYQVNHMYWRYFFWNFVGRQNDKVSYGENLRNGQWISGIDFIDEGIRGVNNDVLPGTLNNKGRNAYYFLPLILGILGICLQLKKGREGSHSLWVVFLLWVMTGLAVIVYLNQTPYQPRERDYAYAGSFYAFSIWVGLGAVYIGELIKKYTKSDLISIVSAVLCIAIPIQMLGQNWDDHNRSGRYMARDFGAQFLQSCPKNALLFTLGDNDTFPVWYNQEVEGLRQDVKVCNIGYTLSDWYIPQMKRKTYDAAPFPSVLPNEFYRSSMSERVYIPDNVKDKTFDLRQFINVLKQPKSQLIRTSAGGEKVALCPAGKLVLKVDKEQVLKSGIVPKESENLIVDEIVIDLSSKQGISRDELFILDMLASTDWSRPICFSITCGSKINDLGLQKYMTLEGLAYKMTPALLKGDINLDRSYDIIANEFKWGNTNDTTLYIDETVQRSISAQKTILVSVARELTTAGETQKALDLADIFVENINGNVLPYDKENFEMVRIYSDNGEKEKAADYLQIMFDDFETQMNYLQSLEAKANVASSFIIDRRDAEVGLVSLANIASAEKLPNGAEIKARIEKLKNDFQLVKF